MTPSRTFPINVMPKKHYQRILALDPGTRYIGYAVLHGTELLYHGVKVLPARRDYVAACRSAKKAVEEIIKHLKPSILAIENSFQGRGKGMKTQAALVRALRSVGRKYELKTLCFAPSTIRKFLCGYGWAGKRDAASMVILRYPELRSYIVRDRQWKERFHGHMFDAVAVGLFARHKLHS